MKNHLHFFRELFANKMNISCPICGGNTRFDIPAIKNTVIGGNLFIDPENNLTLERGILININTGEILSNRQEYSSFTCNFECEKYCFLLCCSMNYRGKFCKIDTLYHVYTINKNNKILLSYESDIPTLHLQETDIFPRKVIGESKDDFTFEEIQNLYMLL